MTRPSFFFSCRFGEHQWQDNRFGGKMLILCRRASLKECDDSICMRLGAKITEKQVEKPGIVVRAGSSKEEHSACNREDMGANSIQSTCDRCHSKSSQLYPHIFEDDFGEKRKMDLCWDCDNDVMNGGDPFEDAGEVLWSRWENDHEYDPLYYPPPQFRSV